jgi:transcriptional regulator with XRE-family HTH domain
MSPISLRLRELREAAGLSQVALAERAGVRQATVSDLETGKSKGIDFATLEALADALGTTAEQLLVHTPRRRRRSS